MTISSEAFIKKTSILFIFDTKWWKDNNEVGRVVIVDTDLGKSMIDSPITSNQMRFYVPDNAMITCIGDPHKSLPVYCEINKDNRPTEEIVFVYEEERNYPADSEEWSF